MLTAQEIWMLVLAQLQIVIDARNFKNWFTYPRPLTGEEESELHHKQDEPVAGQELIKGLGEPAPSTIHPRKLFIGVPTDFFRDWLRDHFTVQIYDALKTLRESGKITEDIEIVFVTCKNIETQPITETDTEDGNAYQSLPIAPMQKPLLPDDTHSFANFVSGLGNRVAYAAAMEAVENPGREYNPLFLYGDTSLGKSHLCRAMAYEFSRRHPDWTIICQSAETMLNFFTRCQQEKSMAKFRARYRRANALFLDDIDIIAGKLGTEKEFYYTFNALFGVQIQIVLVSNCHPKKIPNLDRRLAARFSEGLVQELTMPDTTVKSQILQQLAQESGITLKEEVAMHIARIITGNIRELRGAFLTLRAVSKNENHPINIKMVDELLKIDGHKPITIENVLEATATQCFSDRSAGLRALKSKARQADASGPRHLAMFLCRTLIPGLSLDEIGAAFGGRDHTTITYACTKVDRNRKRNHPPTIRLLESITTRINAS